MKVKTAEFLKKVFLTTFTAFFLITLLYVGVFALFGNNMDGGKQTFFQFFSYLFGKLFACIFPFSLCLGLSARLFEIKKPRALMRLVHFLICFAGYFIFMDLVWNFLFEAGDVPTGQIIRHTLPFFIFYPITAGITALGRALFSPKEEKEHKSILD
jgi:hypothetical protein